MPDGVIAGVAPNNTSIRQLNAHKLTLLNGHDPGCKAVPAISRMAKVNFLCYYLALAHAQSLVCIMSSLIGSKSVAKDMGPSPLQNPKKVARRGRPPHHGQAKVALNLSLTLRTHYYLGLVAYLQKTSMSEIIEEFATAMNERQRGLAPLGRGSRRKGNKAMRGQPINYDERKVPLNLSVTPETKRILKQMAEGAHDPQVRASMSDVVERHCRCLAELYEDNYPYPGYQG